MVSLHELTKPIYHGTLKQLQDSPQKPLESLQGNILQGHGRDRSVHIFLQFKGGKESDVKSWIRCLANKCLTSAQRQLVDRTGPLHPPRRGTVRPVRLGRGDVLRRGVGRDEKRHGPGVRSVQTIACKRLWRSEEP